MTPAWVRALVLRWANARSRLDAGHQRWHVIVPELRMEIWGAADEIQAHRWGLIDQYSRDTWSLTEQHRQQQHKQQQGGTNGKTSKELR